MPKTKVDTLDYKHLLNDVKTLNDFETVMSQLYKEGIQHLLKSEMSHFLGYDKHQVAGNNTGNSRNGTTKKLLKSENGKIEVDVPRNRNGDFQPIILPKRQSTTEKIEQVITGLYAWGMSTADISTQIKEIYGVDISKGFVSNITLPVQITYPDLWKLLKLPILIVSFVWYTKSEILPNLYPGKTESNLLKISKMYTPLSIKKMPKNNLSILPSSGKINILIPLKAGKITGSN